MSARVLRLLALIAAVAACASPAVVPAPVRVRDTLATLPPGPTALPQLPPESTYGKLFLTLSEPAGYFPSENVVSNETSYLHVLDAMRRIGVKGGAYIGVGPDGTTDARISSPDLTYRS